MPWKSAREGWKGPGKDKKGQWRLDWRGQKELKRAKESVVDVQGGLGRVSVGEV